MVGVAPFPGKDRESWAWLLEQDGPVTDVETLLARCAYFSPTEANALVVLAEVVTAVAAWRDVALAPWWRSSLTNWMTSRRRTARLAVQHCTFLLYTCQDCHCRLCHPHRLGK